MKLKVNQGTNPILAELYSLEGYHIDGILRPLKPTEYLTIAIGWPFIKRIGEK